jgi:hypothetical protein
MEKETKINWEQDFFYVHHSIVSAVYRVEFVSGMMLREVAGVILC